MILVGIVLFLWGGLEAAAALGLGDDVAWSALGDTGAAWMASRPLLHALVAVVLLAAAWFVMRRSRSWQDLLTQGGRDPGRLWPRLLGGLLAGGGCYLVLIQIAEFRHLATRTTDFRTFMEAARAAGTAAGPYAATGGGYFYPPPFAHLMRPLALLPLGVASTLWLAFKSAVLVALMVRVRSTYDAGFSLVQVRWLTWGLLIGTARFWLADLAFGNSNLVVAALVTVALLDDLAGRSRRAGLALGTAVVVKLVPVVLVPGFLACGRTRTLVWAGGTVLSLVVLSVVAAAGHGPAEWEAYLHQGVLAKLGESLAQPDNQSLRGLCERLLGGGVPARAAWLGASTAVLLVAVRTSRLAQQAQVPAARPLAAALWPLVVLLVSPGSWVVHYVMVILPYAALLSQLLAEPRSRLLQVTFVAVNLVFTVSGWWRPTVRWSIEQSWFVLAVLLMFAVLVLRIRARTQEPPAVATGGSSAIPNSG